MISSDFKRFLNQFKLVQSLNKIVLNLWKLPEIASGHIKIETGRYRDALELKLSETILE